MVIGILAHVDAGKTTLSEAMLYFSGSIRQMGRVDNKDAFLDTYELERSRGITIFSKQALFRLGDRQATLLDTPGHVDFSAEMERTLQVLDYAVLVISGADGVQGHTVTLWRLLKKYNLPVFLFINKMDQNGTDKDALMVELKKRLSGECIDFTKKVFQRRAAGVLREYSNGRRSSIGCFFGARNNSGGRNQEIDYGAQNIPLFFRFRPEIGRGKRISSRTCRLYAKENIPGCLWRQSI